MSAEPKPDERSLIPSEVAPEPRSPYGRDPVDRARVVQLLRHVQLRALEDALGDPERDAVDEEALPELEGRGRRLLQAGEVGQVAAERVPALGLELAVLRAPAPDPYARDAKTRSAAFSDRADADRDQHDVAPARRARRASRAIADPEQDDRERRSAPISASHERAAAESTYHLRFSIASTTRVLNVENRAAFVVRSP